MESETAFSVDYTPTSPSASTKQQLAEFLSENTGPLLGILRSYVQRMSLASGQDVATTAVEVFQEVVVEALEHADRFDPTGQPKAWLLGIAANIIRRRKTERAKRARRELFVGDLSITQQESLNENALFDLIISDSAAGPEQEIEDKEQAMQLLSLVSEEDRRLLLLAFCYGFEREMLAEKLGITAGAARVRLHRALNRLRLAWREQNKKVQGGESNE